jgi:hypothetical protein
MYLAIYRFPGDAVVLAAAYDRLQDSFPHGPWGLRGCVVQDDGIVVVDACPTQAAFESFATSPQFHAALASVGLPRPQIEPLGEVHDLRVGPGLTTPVPSS